MAGTYEGEDSVSMEDVIVEQEQLEADANAVLGDCDDKNCTYPQGYVSRQAVYACNTCEAGGSSPGGVCLACSYACHEGHDLHELYTKRQFRCDCGNEKFPSMKCTLYEFKSETNDKNRYNQNFSGLYCTCSRPYPDEDDTVPDEMIQCVVCEDWYHGRHVDAVIPDNDNYDEMICPRCMNQHPWLWAYTVSESQLIRMERDRSARVVDVSAIDSNDTTPGDTDDTSRVSCAASSSLPGDGSETNPSDDPPAGADHDESVGCRGVSTSLSLARSTECLGACVLSELRMREVNSGTGGVFWMEGWREKLCRCSQCLKMYELEGVSFLTDASDSVRHYEHRGHASRSDQSQLERGMTALQGIDRVVLGEVIQGYNDLKESLKVYLKKFAENKKVVRAEDIREFFGEMEARKKRRLDTMPPTRCK